MSSDDQAPEDLLLGYSSDVERYARAVVKSSHLVEDVVQQTYLRALTWIKSNPLPQRPHAWLVRIARNVAYTMLEKEGHYELNEGGIQDVIQDEEPPDIAARMELVETVQENIARLSPRYQRLVLGMYREGRSIRQLAKEEGLGHTNTKVTIYRARRKLETLLERDCSALVSDFQNP